ncbi:MAG: amidohydrolase family protein [Acidobacteria bacterium]|nr:amidohydrolase family protein [Acidobacteriota bacterium]
MRYFITWGSVFAVLSIAACGTTPGGKSASTERPPIIDMHMHASDVTFTDDGKPLLRPCRPEPCTRLPAEFGTDEEVLQGTLAAMEKYNIVKAVLSEGDFDRLRHWVDAAPARFIPSPAWSSTFPDIDFPRAEYRAGRFEAMGEIGTQYAGIAPDDPRLEPYFALAEELDLPLLIHVKGAGAPNPRYRISMGSPLLLEDTLVRHPKLRLYLEDAAYPFADELIALLSRHPQVYTDLSASMWIMPREAFHNYLYRLMREGLGKRLMFGSDQMQWPEVIGVAIESIETAPFLSEDEKRDIFYNNAARFLRLEQE